MTQNTLKIQKIRDVKTPTRAYSTDAGIDFYVPNVLAETDFGGGRECMYLIDASSRHIISIEIPPHASVLIPSGIKVAVPDNYTMIFFNKSGVATKKHLDVGACVVDSGYRNEVHIHLTNTSDKIITIRPGEKIVQAVVLPINICVPELVDDINELGPTDRGMGGFGSTGTK